MILRRKAGCSVLDLSIRSSRLFNSLLPEPEPDLEPVLEPELEPEPEPVPVP